MTHTPRTLSLVAALLLTLAACTDDLTQTTATTPDGDLAGQPVQLSTTAPSVTPADTPQTRATEPETDFPTEGTTMTVYLLADDGTLIQQADYTYSATTGDWTSTSTAPLRWPTSTAPYRFTAISPAAMADACTDGTTLPLTLPTEWTAADLATYEQLRTTSAATKTTPTTGRVTLSLHHPLAKIQVISTSSAPVYLTDAPATGTVTLDGKTTADIPTTAGLVQLATTDNALTYQGYVLPTTTAFGILSDKLLTLPAGGLQAGTSLTTTSATDVTIISCTTPGTLADAWPVDNPATKVLITGTLNADDITTLKSHKEITHLYITANVEDNTYWEKLTFPPDYDKLQEVYLAEATCIARNAFYHSNATKVNAPKATSIKEEAFLSSQVDSINVPQVRTIEKAGLNGAKMGTISLPMVETIGNGAFTMCERLTSICLPTGVTFGNRLFDGCTSLTTLYLNCPEAEFNEATHSNYGGFGWKEIYYGYRGTGDYLAPASYTGHWTAPTNP